MSAKEINLSFILYNNSRLFIQRLNVFKRKINPSFIIISRVFLSIIFLIGRLHVIIIILVFFLNKWVVIIISI